MRNIYLELIAPLLRGLTFDGQKGEIVVFSREAAVKLPGSEILSFSANEKAVSTAHEQEEALAQQLSEAFSAYRGKHGKNPAVVQVKGCGSFFLGKSVDEARAKLLGKTGPEAGQRARPARRGSGSTNARRVERNSVVQGKVAVVTGGARGFGAGLARGLAAAGSVVFIADLDGEKSRKLAEELNSLYQRTVAIAVEADVSDEDSVRAMIAEIVRRAGGFDLFISNAGVLKAGSVKEMDLKDFRFVTEVNYYGYFLCVKHASRIMALQNRAAGRYFTDIIQINSKSGLSGSQKNGAYAGSKFGALGLTQSFALELVADNIKVNAICPGNFFEGPLWSDPDRGLFVQYLATGKVPGAKTTADVKAFYEAKVPMKRGCRPDDLLKAIFYLVEQQYETGQALPVTGGQVMLN